MSSTILICVRNIRHGAQGILDSASKAALENEFGTSKDEDVVQQILEKGDIQEATVCLFPSFLNADMVSDSMLT